MTSPKPSTLSTLTANRFAGAVAVVLALIFATVVAVPIAPAKTYQVLHYFTGNDGENPSASMVFDKRGNLYSTTYRVFGTVFEMRPYNQGWIFSPLKSLGFEKGSFPQAGVTLGPDGTLYGTTYSGGNANCSCGVVFNLKPPVNAQGWVLSGWNETVLYNFTGGTDGSTPGYGNVVFDNEGNLYGTTQAGGAYGQGTVYKLTKSNGAWTENIIYNFSGGNDGGTPYAGVIFDNAGNLYGTASAGGAYGGGTVYELSTNGSGWTQTVLHSLSGPDGTVPYGGLNFRQHVKSLRHHPTGWARGLFRLGL